MINIPEEVRITLENGSVNNFYIQNEPYFGGDLSLHSSFVIKGDQIVYESVKLTESINSSDHVRFGMAEGSILEFETAFQTDITGRRIVAYLEVPCSEEISNLGHFMSDPFHPGQVLYLYSILYGHFEVAESSKNDIGLTKYTCYSIVPNDMPESWFKRFTYNYLPNGSLDNLTRQWLSNYFFTNVHMKKNENIFTYSAVSSATVDTFPLTKVFEMNGSGVWAGETYQVYVTGKRLTYMNATSWSKANSIFYVHDRPLNNETFNTYINAINLINYPPKMRQFLTELYKDNFYLHDELVNDIDHSFSFKSRIFPIDNNHVCFGGLVAGSKSLLIPTSIAIYVNGSMASMASFEAMTELFEECEIIEDLGKFFENEFTEGYQEELIDRLLYGNDGIHITTPFRNDEMLDSFCEIYGWFGRYNRYGNFEPMKYNLNIPELYPHETLYPSDILYPRGTELFNTGTYLSCNLGNDFGGWFYQRIYADFDYAGKEIRYSAFSSDGLYDDKYEMDVSDNVFFKLANSSEKVEFVDELMNKYLSLQYKPMQLTLVGKPYLEAGDVLEVVTPNGTYKTIVMRQVIEGIQQIKTSIEVK